MGAKVDVLITDGQWYRIVTSIPLHGSPTHLLMNMAWLALFGVGVVFATRTNIALTVFWLCGIIGQVASYLVGIGNNIGASGGIFGLAGYGAAKAWQLASVANRDMRWRIRLSVVVLFIGVLAGPLAFEGVDHAAHLGGAAAGLALGPIQHRALERATTPTLAIVLGAYLWWAFATAVM